MPLQLIMMEKVDQLKLSIIPHCTYTQIYAEYIPGRFVKVISEYYTKYMGCYQALK